MSAPSRSAAPPLRERTFLLGALALCAGVGLAAFLAMTSPLDASWSVRIPTELARRLSSTGSDVVTLARPAALWLVPIAAMPFFIVILLRSLVDAPRWQLGLQLLLRTAALLAVALALTMPSLESPIRGKTVVFVVDTSASVDGSQLEQARALLAIAL